MNVTKESLEAELTALKAQKEQFIRIQNSMAAKVLRTDGAMEMILVLLSRMDEEKPISEEVVNENIRNIRNAVGLPDPAVTGHPEDDKPPKDPN